MDDDLGENPLAQFVLPERLERIEHVLTHRTESLTIVLDGVKNFHNISAVIRSADAFGLHGIHLVGDSFEYSKDISLGTERWVELAVHSSAKKAAQDLKARNYTLVTLQPETHCGCRKEVRTLPVTEIPFEEKIALVFGNELTGVSPELAEAAEIEAFIPMKGFVESLNISVACAICLFCSTISGALPAARTKPISEKSQNALRQTWLAKSVKHADRILQEIEQRKERK